MARLKILSQDEHHTNHIRDTLQILNHDTFTMGFLEYMKFEELLDRSLGLYDAETDSICLSADVIADEPDGTRFLRHVNFTFPESMPLPIKNAAIVEVPSKDQAGADWECNVSATLKLCTNKAGQSSQEFSFQRVFHSKSHAWGCGYFMELETLLNPENGWIGRNSITLEANFTVNPMKGINDLLHNAATETITVDGNNIKVNKYQLAMHSTYFERLFFSNDFPKKDTIELQPPANFTHFCRMLAALPPKNRPLDDNCIEGVLHLADRFMLNEVEGKCRLFLVEQSKKPALFKFRLAAKYGWTGLKEQILSDLTKDDFDSSKFYQNMDESDKMDQDSANAVRAAHARLFAIDNEGPPAKRARN